MSLADALEGKIKFVLEHRFEERAWLEQICWSNDGKFIAVSAGKQLKLFRRDGSLHRTYPSLDSTISSMCFRKGQTEFAVSAYGGVKTFRPEGVIPKRSFSWKGSILKVTWSPDGKYLACGTQENSLHCWIVEKVKDFKMSGFMTKVQEISWHHSSKALAVAGGGAVTVWDFRDGPPLGKEPLVLDGHVDFISHLSFSNHSDALASAGYDGQVFLWQPSFDEPKRVMNRGEPARCLSWSQDDSYVVVGFEDGIIEVCQVDLNEML